MIAQADARTIPLTDKSMDCCVTSPPYWGLRDYGLGDLGVGLEATLEEYVANIVQVFREVWRVLKPEGTLWLNLGDCYANDGKWGGVTGGKHAKALHGKTGIGRQKVATGLKPKNLVGIPWRVAFALQADGWYLRSDCIWHKPNPMPENVRDRPTKAHEYLFLLAKQARYYYDAEAIKEPSTGNIHGRGTKLDPPTENAGIGHVGWQRSMTRDAEIMANGRNRWTVWTIPTSPYKGAHFATFPPALVEPCILAGTSAKGNCPVCGKAWERIVKRQSFGKKDYEGKHLATEADAADRRILAGVRAAREAGGEHDNPFPAAKTIGWRPTCDHDADPIPAIVLDPFCGSGTVGEVCRKHERRFIGLDLSMKYLHELALPRAEDRQIAKNTQ